MCGEEAGKRLPTVLVTVYLASDRAAASWTPAIPLGRGSVLGLQAQIRKHEPRNCSFLDVHDPSPNASALLDDPHQSGNKGG